MDSIFLGIKHCLDRALSVLTEVWDRATYYCCDMPFSYSIRTIVHSLLVYRVTGLSIVLELMETSNTVSTFKKRKNITLPIRFTTIRNFSLQKNLSISA